MGQDNNNAPPAHTYDRITEPCQEWNANTDLNKKSNRLEFVDIKIEEAEGTDRLDHTHYQ